MPAKEQYWRNPEKYRQLSRDYTRDHNEEINQRRAKFRRESPENVKAWNDKYRKKNPQKHQIWRQNWKNKNPKKAEVHRLISNNPELYPLENYCIFCGDTKNVEHAHLDYEDEGFNYVTACHRCNSWMDKGVQ